MVGAARIGRALCTVVVVATAVALSSCGEQPGSRRQAATPLRDSRAPYVAAAPAYSMPPPAAPAQRSSAEVFHVKVPDPTYMLDDYHALFHTPGCSCCPPEGPWAYGTRLTRGELEAGGHYTACEYCLGPGRDQTYLQDRRYPMQRPDATGRPSDATGTTVTGASFPSPADSAGRVPAGAPATSSGDAGHTNVCERCGDGPYRSSTGKWHSNPNCADHAN